MKRAAFAMIGCMVASICGIGPAAANGSMTCTFNEGVVKTFEKGVFSNEKVEPLKFRIDEVDLVG